MAEKFGFKISRYSMITHLYFFFNSLFLPLGLLYTHLLTPWFYYKLWQKTKMPVMPRFLIALFLFDLVHLYNGVELKSFVVSNLLFISSYIFVLACSDFIRSHHNLELRFKELLISNFIFTLIALVVLLTPWRESLWYVQKITNNTPKIPRLALLTYEASYYSTLLIPIVFYYLTKLFMAQNKMPSISILIMAVFPLLISLSFGVIGASLVAIAAIFILHWGKIFYKKYVFHSIIFLLGFAFITVFLLYVFHPENLIFLRIRNILDGIDTSAKGRTSDSYTLAYKVASERSIWFGTGLGQIKTLAPAIVAKHLNYWGVLETVRIPNTIAETFATFGILGLIIRFTAIFYFFIKTKVLSNYYQTVLFVFVFIYQFTGSFLVNVTEFVIWILAFSPVFPHFNVKAGQ
jgi:hypothetical protein